MRGGFGLQALGGRSIRAFDRREAGTGFAVNKQKLLKKVLGGSRNVRFTEMAALLDAFGFRLSRVSGSHHIFAHPDVPELLNLQNVRGQAKPYQIQQFLRLVERYNLRMEDDS